MNKNSLSKRALLLTAFGGLAALSDSAISQSMEYRRGYDQGYRDGAAAQSNEGQRGQIVIDDARYGSRGNSCDARDTLQRAAGWRRHLVIRVNNDLCGDPAPDRPKRLEVRYRCGDGPGQRTEAREGSDLAISCR